MQMRDEDSQINITLLEFLKQNYEITIPGMNPPPQDEHGMDMPEDFCNDPKSGDEHGNVGCAGSCRDRKLFFSQFVMWNDIHNNRDFLEEQDRPQSDRRSCGLGLHNPGRSGSGGGLFTGNGGCFSAACHQYGCRRVSFVLHGPPGTGKSQTITALIANALTKGKTVLLWQKKSCTGSGYRNVWRHLESMISA